MDWKQILEGVVKKAIVDSTDQGLVAGAAFMAEVVCKQLRPASAVRFAGLFFSEVYKRAKIERKAAIELIPL